MQEEIPWNREQMAFWSDINLKRDPQLDPLTNESWEQRYRYRIMMADRPSRPRTSAKSVPFVLRIAGESAPLRREQSARQRDRGFRPAQFDRPQRDQLRANLGNRFRPWYRRVFSL